MRKALLKKISILAVPTVIIIGLLVYFFGSFQTDAIPADFTAAREKAAVISQDIVGFTNETAAKIELANQAEAGGDEQKTISLINDAKVSNRMAYQKAFELSSALREMTSALSGVHGSQQQAGYEAVAVELSLTSEFISYTDALDQFLNALTNSFLAKDFPNRKILEGALKSVNDKIKLINDLNRSFNEKMSVFDKAS